MLSLLLFSFIFVVGGGRRRRRRRKLSTENLKHGMIILNKGERIIVYYYISNPRQVHRSYNLPPMIKDGLGRARFFSLSLTSHDGRTQPLVMAISDLEKSQAPQWVTNDKTQIHALPKRARGHGNTRKV